MEGPVEAAIRAKVKPGTTLTTFAQKKAFRVGGINDKGVVLLLGDSEAGTLLTWSCLERVPTFLEGKDWVSIGGKHETEVDRGKLDEYFREHCKPPIKIDVARYAARLLWEAGVVGAKLGRSVQVRV